MTFTLRPYQQEAVDATLARFRKHREPAAIVLPTGAGKSTVIAELARGPRTRAGAGARQRAGGAKPRQILRARPEADILPPD